MTVNLELVEYSVNEEPIVFSFFNYKTWLWWKYRRFKVAFLIPPKEPFRVAECFSIPPTIDKSDVLHCVLLTTFSESKQKLAKRNTFYIELECPAHVTEVVFKLAVQVKHSVHVSL